MPKAIEVQFDSGTDRLRAVVDATPDVKGVLILRAESAPGAAMTGRQFAEKLGLTFQSGLPLPREVRVKKGNAAVELTGGEQGPGVCYWVGSTLVCW